MYPREIFTTEEISLIEKCIALSLEEGLIFPSWEFSILTGMSFNEARMILKNWPELELEKNDTARALRVIFNNLAGYPHKKEALILSETGLDLDGVHRLFKRFPKN